MAGFHSDAEWERYTRDLLASLPAVLAVAGHIVLSGVDVTIHGMRFAGRKDDKIDFVDPGDIKTARGWIDVKHRMNLDFTCREDYPFKTIYCGQWRPHDEGEIPYRTIVCNKPLTHFALIKRSSRPLWLREDVPNSREGCVRPSWACPIELAEFHELKRP
jgi:hypothetical protein